MATISACSSGIPEPQVQADDAVAEPTGPLTTPELTEALEQIVNNVKRRYPGDVGIAVANGHETASAGDENPLQSWSSIKVPIAIAAMRNDNWWIDSMQASIKWSDNDAAIRLWNSLPDPKGEVAEVLKEAHGTQTTFIEEVTEPTYDAFGEPLWSVPEQAQFANHLTCIADSEEVVAAMGDIDPDQSYGLGKLNNAHFKGGWGPDDETGAYSARQFGLVTIGGTDVAVSIFAQSDEGNYDTEQLMLTMMARKLAKLAGRLPAAECPLPRKTGTATSASSTAPTTSSSEMVTESAESN